jgi:hypothetical protein
VKGRGHPLAAPEKSRTLVFVNFTGRLTEAMTAGGEVAERTCKAMMPMKKIDLTAIEAAVRG